MGGRGEGGGDLVAGAEMKVTADIIRHVIVEDRGARAIGFGGLGDCRQRVDRDRDHFGGVLGERKGLGDHGGDRLADMPHLVPGQRITRRA